MKDFRYKGFNISGRTLLITYYLIMGALMLNLIVMWGWYFYFKEVLSLAGV